MFLRYASIGFVGGCLPNPNASLRSFGTRLAYLQGKQSFPLTPSFLSARFAVTLSLIVSRAILLIMHLSQFFWIFFCIITRFTSPTFIFIIVFISIVKNRIELSLSSMLLLLVLLISVLLFFSLFASLF